MSTIIRTVALLVMLATAIASPTPPDIQGDFEQEDEEFQANYHGAFDSMAGEEWDNEPPEFDHYFDNAFEETEQDLLQFSEHMADFIPDEAFNFNLERGEEEAFSIHPPPNVHAVRGMFQSDLENVQDEDEGGYVNLEMFDNGQLIRTYRRQRLGIFNVNHNLKDHHYTFKFSSQSGKMNVYFSYEAVIRRINQEDPPNQTNMTEIQEVTEKFERVNSLIAQQQTQMNRILTATHHHQLRVNSYLNSLAWGILVETLVMIAGGLVSLSMLQRQIYAGYEVV